MNTSSIHIKNMVCDRCKLVIEQLFKRADIEPILVTLGEVKISEQNINKEKIGVLDKLLTEHGFERIDDKKSKLLEQIKATIIEFIHHRDQFELNINWSHYLSEKLQYDYNYLSSLFSTVTGVTIEQYIIKQKIEKVKELLIYDELSIKEIAYRLGYSSVAHLSTQFKKVTGLTPTAFKDLHSDNSRKPLDLV